MINKTICFVLFIFLSLALFAKDDLDSLWAVWSDETAPDTCRAKALIQFSWNGYLFSQPDSAFYFAQMMYDFSSVKNLKKEMAWARRLQGAAYHVKGEYPKALDYYERSLAFSEDANDKNGIAAALNNIGVIYRLKGLYPKAIEYYQRSLKIKQETSDGKEVADADILNNIGVIYQEKGDHFKALEYFEKSFIIQEELSNLGGMADALNNIGLCYKYLGDYSTALEYHRRSLKINEDIKAKLGLAHALNNMGEVYMYQGDYVKALDYSNRSLEIKEEISDKKGIVNTLNFIGKIYFKQYEFKQAIQSSEQALNMALEINYLKGQKDSYQVLYDANKTLGNDEQALLYHERKLVLVDSLQIIETTKKLQQMEFAKQLFADSLKRVEERLKMQMIHDAEVRKKNRTRNIYIILASFLLVFAIGYHRRMILVRRSKRVIDREKERSDNLLLNILPQEVADELKEKGRAEARNFDTVTILFSHFKGFARISQKLSAEELVEEINSCFEPFDKICRKYGIEKIKTMGDAYMAAGGIPVPSDQAVKNTVLAGLEMMSFINNKKNDKKLECQLCFEIQIGIHTGPVVAGIVGTSKFHYDIWGDAVNTASRIKDAGEVGKVNISQSTYELIKDDTTFKFKQRGKIMTKGKGDIDMWFVEKVG